MKKIFLLIITFTIAKKFDKCISAMENRHYCGLINAYSNLQHILQFTYLGYKKINLTIQCDPMEKGQGETVYYKVDTKFYIHYAEKHCVNYNVTPTFEMQDDHYFNERSCCDLGQYLDFETKRCVNVDPFYLKDGLEKRFERYEKYVKNSWIEKKWKAKPLVDYYVDLSDFYSDKLKSKAKIQNNMKFILNLTKENESYCIARTNKTILLRVDKAKDCNKNICIGKCTSKKGNLIYVSWYMFNSTDITSIKKALSQDIDLVLRSTFSCEDKLEKMKFPWSLQDQGDLTLTDENIILKRDEYCFNVESNEIVVYTCNNYFNEVQRISPNTSKNECETVTCVNVCNEIGTMTTSLSELSLKKKYIYVNDTFLRHNRYSFLDSMETVFNDTFNCPDGFETLPFSWSILDQKVLSLPDYNIFLSKTEYCLNFDDDDVLVIVCKSTLSEVIDNMKKSLTSDCERISCIRKCSEINNQNINIIVYKFGNSMEIFDVKSALLRTPEITIEKSFECPNEIVTWKKKWSVINQGELNLSEYNLVLTNDDDYCFKNENDAVQVYMCQSTIDKLENMIHEMKIKECQINKCIRKCGGRDNKSMNVTLYKYISTGNDIKYTFENMKEITYQEIFACSDGFEKVQEKWDLTEEGNLHIFKSDIILHQGEYCFAEEDNDINAYICSKKSLQINNDVSMQTTENAQYETVNNYDVTTSFSQIDNDATEQSTEDVENSQKNNDFTVQPTEDMQHSQIENDFTVQPTNDVQIIQNNNDAFTVQPTENLQDSQTGNDDFTVQPTDDVQIIQNNNDAFTVQPTKDLQDSQTGNDDFTVQPTDDVLIIQNNNDALTVQPTENVQDSQNNNIFTVPPTEDMKHSTIGNDGFTVQPTKDLQSEQNDNDALTVQPTEGEQNSQISISVTMESMEDFQNDITTTKVNEEFQQLAKNSNKYLRKCGNIENNIMYVYLYHYDKIINNNVQKLLLNPPGEFSQEQFHCLYGYEVLQHEWSLTEHGDLIILIYDLVIKQDEYCFYTDNDNGVEIHTCKETIYKIEETIEQIKNNKGNPVKNIVIIGSSTVATSTISASIIYVLYKRWKKKKSINNHNANKLDNIDDPN